MHWRFKLTHYNNKNERSYDELVNNDKKTFQDMEKGRITYAHALKRFKENNVIDDDISMDEFVAWLQGLGWNV